jgi:hypothetical protein
MTLLASRKENRQKIKLMSLKPRARGKKIRDVYTGIN